MSERGEAWRRLHKAGKGKKEKRKRGERNGVEDPKQG